MIRVLSAPSLVQTLGALNKRKNIVSAQSHCAHNHAFSTFKPKSENIKPLLYLTVVCQAKEGPLKKAHKDAPNSSLGLAKKQKSQTKNPYLLDAATQNGMGASLLMSYQTKKTLSAVPAQSISYAGVSAMTKKPLYTSYSKNDEVKLVTIGLASATRIRLWADKTLPNGKVVGEVTNANTLHHKNFKPQKGGLFCERIFGPLKDFECACGNGKKMKLFKGFKKKDSKGAPNSSLGPLSNLDLTSLQKVEDPNVLIHNSSLGLLKNSRRFFCAKCDVEYTWSVIRRYQLGYIKLNAPVTHVWYVKGNPSYISLLLDMKKKHLEYIAYCTETLTLENSLKGEQFFTLSDSSAPNDIFEAWEKVKESTPKQSATIDLFSNAPTQSAETQTNSTKTGFGSKQTVAHPFKNSFYTAKAFFKKDAVASLEVLKNRKKVCSKLKFGGSNIEQKTKNVQSKALNLPYNSLLLNTNSNTLGDPSSAWDPFSKQLDQSSKLVQKYKTFFSELRASTRENKAAALESLTNTAITLGKTQTEGYSTASNSKRNLGVTDAFYSLVLEQKSKITFTNVLDLKRQTILNKNWVKTPGATSVTNKAQTNNSDNLEPNSSKKQKTLYYNAPLIDSKLTPIQLRKNTNVLLVNILQYIYKESYTTAAIESSLRLKALVEIPLLLDCLNSSLPTKHQDGSRQSSNANAGPKRSYGQKNISAKAKLLHYSSYFLKYVINLAKTKLLNVRILKPISNKFNSLQQMGLNQKTINLFLIESFGHKQGLCKQVFIKKLTKVWHSICKGNLNFKNNLQNKETVQSEALHLHLVTLVRLLFIRKCKAPLCTKKSTKTTSSLIGLNNIELKVKQILLNAYIKYMAYEYNATSVELLQTNAPIVATLVKEVDLEINNNYIKTFAKFDPKQLIKVCVGEKRNFPHYSSKIDAQKKKPLTENHQLSLRRSIETEQPFVPVIAKFNKYLRKTFVINRLIIFIKKVVLLQKGNIALFNSAVGAKQSFAQAKTASGSFVHLHWLTKKMLLQCSNSTEYLSRRKAIFKSYNKSFLLKRNVRPSSLVDKTQIATYKQQRSSLFPMSVETQNFWKKNQLPICSKLSLGAKPRLALGCSLKRDNWGRPKALLWTLFENTACYNNLLTSIKKTTFASDPIMSKMHMSLHKKLSTELYNREIKKTLTLQNFASESLQKTTAYEANTTRYKQPNNNTIVNNIYCLSHRELWDQEKDWQFFASYFLTTPNIDDKVIPVYSYRHFDFSLLNTFFSKEVNTQTPVKFFELGRNTVTAKDSLNSAQQSLAPTKNNYLNSSKVLSKAWDLDDKQNLNVSFSGAGMIQKLLAEYDYFELKQMDKQNRILLYDLNKYIRKLKKSLWFVSKPSSKNGIKGSKSKNSLEALAPTHSYDTSNSTLKKYVSKNKKLLKDICKQRDALIRRTKFIRKIFRNLMSFYKAPDPLSAQNALINQASNASQTYNNVNANQNKESNYAPEVQNQLTSMILNLLPVLPPDLRPIVKMGNQIAASDLNRLYQRVIYRNDRLKKFLKDPTTNGSFEMKYAQRLLQEAVDNLIQNGKSGVVPEKDARGRALKSLSDLLKGKQGRFRQHLLGKRVDYSGRSVIVVGPKLKINECGIPKEMALELYLPFLIKRILNQNLARTVIGAKALIQNNKPLTWSLLREIMKTCPVLLNRAPTLHRLGFQAFQPKLVDGRAILLHPLVCPAFNADFDGDQMAVHVPISAEARAEAWKLMLSRNNLLTPATGEPLVLPSQDMVLGCYYLTTNSNLSKQKYEKGYGSYFDSLNDVLRAYNQGLINIHTIVWVKWNYGPEAKIESTNDLEQPLELRVNRYGNYHTIYSKSQVLFAPSQIRYAPLVHKNARVGASVNPLEKVSKAQSSKLQNPAMSQTKLEAPYYCKPITRIIKTTPGKILFNVIIQQCLGL